LGYPHAPRATAQGIHFRSTAIVQSVSGDARDVPLTNEFLRWLYGLGARERQSCPFFGNDACFTARARGACHSIAASSCLQTTAHIWPNSIDFCDSKNARHNRNVAGRCWKSPFMQMSQAFRPMSCRFETLRRFLLSQPRLLHSLTALLAGHVN